MIYPNDIEIRLGFDKIRATVAKMCATQMARQLVEQIQWITDFDTLEQELATTMEMHTVLTNQDDFPTAGYTDINHFLSKAELEGSFLHTEELVELQKALLLLGDIKNFFALRENVPYPLLAAMAAPIENFSTVERDIERIVDKFGRIRDNASPELQTIRRSLSERAGQISKKLHQILRELQKDGFSDEDSAITMRDGRALIPVAAGAKRKVRGFVQGESATGKTAFIEPIEVVELNNEIKELESAERREIIKILTLFTQSLRPHIEPLMDAGFFMAQLDLLLSKARFGSSINATMPIMEHTQKIYLRQARHPLLEQALKKEGKPIVPLDIRLEGQKHILLISGPNAGGKSVCLKTVGLLQYMLQCGFLVPVLENSEMGVFDSIFIDIGDQQSLENDLSTYSSHLQNMKVLLGKATSNSLFLIDEFGSGTEPTTGGAIAESILEQLEKRGSFGIITTHYANLKYYASISPGIENGAMTFDVAQIRPLFKLEQGRAGSSFAFEIARKIGLPETIIARASQKIGSDQVDLEQQLRQATRDKRYWENKRDRIKQIEKGVDQTAAQYENELSQIQTERARLINAAKTEARELINQANRQIEKTIREVKQAAATQHSTKEARQDFNTFRALLQQDEPSVEDAITLKMRLLREKEKRRKERSAQKIQEASAPTPAAPKAPTLPVIGSHVRMKGQNAVGQVISITGKKAAVAFDSVTTQLNLAQLEIVHHAEVKKLIAKPLAASYSTLDRKLDFSQQLDIRGMRVVEAIAQVESFIDQAVMLGSDQVTILHGKGTGALKQEVRQYLSTLPFISSLKDEYEDFGGAGITVVTF